MRSRSALAGFYSQDVEAISAALERVSSPDEPARGREVESVDVPFAPGIRWHPRGLWSRDWFGPPEGLDPEAWATIRLPVFALHPALDAAIGAALDLSAAEVRAVAEARAWLGADGRARVPPGHPGVAAPLRTSLFDWPPEPTYATEVDARIRYKIPETQDFSEWLEAWKRAQGVDLEAVRADDGAWKAEAEERCGPEAIAQELMRRGGRELVERRMVGRVPVPPLGERPLEPRPGGVSVAGARSEALAELWRSAKMLARLMELNTPPVFVRAHRDAMQARLDAALAAWGAAPAPIFAREEDLPEAGGPPPTEPRWPIPGYHAELGCVQGLAFVDARRALVDYRTVTFELDLHTGAVVRSWRSAAFHLLACLEGQALYTGHETWAFSSMEVATGAWRVGPLPACVPFAFAEAYEVSYVIDLATRRCHRLNAVGDYPTGLRVSPCARYLMAADKEGSGAVYRFDGELQFPLEVRWTDAPVLWRDRPPRPATGAEDDRLANRVWDDGVLAIALCERRDLWRRVQENGLVDGVVIQCRFDLPVTAAAFDRAGESLLLAGDDELQLIALEPTPRLLARLDLRGLSQQLLGASPRSRPRADALNAVLCRYGTLVAAAGASLAELADLNVASTYDEPQRLGLRRARRLAACIAGASAAASLPFLPVASA